MANDSTLLGPNRVERYIPEFDVNTGQFINRTPAAVQQATTSSPDQFQSGFASLYPELVNTQREVSGNTLSRLRGELSPETLSAIQDKAARFGIGAGTPGSGIAGSYGRKLLGTTIEGLQSQGLQDYLNTLKAYSGTLMPTTGEQIGAETSRYGTDVSAQTSANALGQQAYQFGLSFPESQRQFDITAQQNYLNNYLNFLQ